MNPEQNKRILIVGTFVFLGLIILLAGVLVMGKQRKTFVKTIAIKAIFTDVGGLMAGNNIWVSGVKVGTVNKVRLYKNTQVEVIMDVEKRSIGFIHKDAKAKIGSDGLIGNRIVVIYGGSPWAPTIQAGDILTVEKALSTDEMINTLQDNNRNLLAITNNFKVISKRMAEGDGTLGKLLKDETLINDLQSTITTLKIASSNVQMLTSNLADYSSKLQLQGTLANDLVTDTSIFSMLRTTVSQIKEVSATANDVANNFKNVSHKLNNASNELDSSNGVIGTLINDKVVAANLKSTLKNLQSSTEKLDENMEAIQHSFLFRRYFKKKAVRDTNKVNSLSKVANVP